MVGRRVLMITSAAVKVFIYPLNKEITIKCHRHCDAYEILYDFNYRREDYETIEQGFLDENEKFYTRAEAWNHAQSCNQIKLASEHISGQLFSEDLW